MNHCHRQQGAALLIALLAVAIAAVLALELIERQQRDLALRRAVDSAEQAWQYAAGIEALARDWIRPDSPTALSIRVDESGWSAPFPVPGGSVQGRVTALGGRLNLNGLASRDPEQREHTQRALLELLRILRLDTDLAGAIARLYAPAADGRRARLIHIGELDVLDAMRGAAGARLLPRLTVLPDPDARLDLNSTRAEILAAYIPGLSAQSARQLLQRRPFESLQQALAAPELSTLAPAFAQSRLSVASQWHRVHARVVLDGQARDFYRLVSSSGSRYDGRFVSLGLP